MMTDTELQNRLNSIQQRVQSACLRVNRDPEEVTLLAVTKFFPHEIARKAYAFGVTHFGENKVQEAIEKYGDRWLFQENQQAQLHLIGHLQSNKVRKAVQLFTSLDSVDSIKLAKSIESEARLAQKRLRVLLEVNTSGEPQKYGLTIEAVNEVVSEIKNYKYIKIAGLMTIGPNTDNTQQVRQSFKNLKNLFDIVQQNHALPYWSSLSMGMSHDFELAIEEGATEIRLGSALFGERS